MFRQLRKYIFPRRLRRLRFPALIFTLLITALLLSTGVWTTIDKTPGSPGLLSTSGIPTHNGSVSPLIFGTNLSLFDSSDQVLNSAVTRRQLQLMHVRIIRMPVRPNLSNSTEIQAAQAIKSIGAYALVVLR